MASGRDHRVDNWWYRSCRRRQERIAGGLGFGRSVVTAASVTAAAYGTYRIASWAWNEVFAEKDEAADVEVVPFTRHVGRCATPRGGRDKENLSYNTEERCRRETLMAFTDLRPSLRSAVESCTNCDEEGKALKLLRRKRRKEFPKREGGDATISGDLIGSGGHHLGSEDCNEARLWELIKRRSIARCLTTAYAHTLIFLTLSVQVRLLRRRLVPIKDDYEESGNISDRKEPTLREVGRTKSDCNSTCCKPMQNIFSSTYAHFITDGINLLAEAIEKAVEERLSSWSMTSTINVSEREFGAGLDAVRWMVEGRRDLIKFVIPPCDYNSCRTLCEDESSRLSQNILNETWDILESPLFVSVLKDSTSLCFQSMREDGWNSFFQPDADAKKGAFNADEIGGEGARDYSHAKKEAPYCGIRDKDVYKEKANAQSVYCPTVLRPLATVVTKLKHIEKAFYVDCTIGDVPEDSTSHCNDRNKSTSRPTQIESGLAYLSKISDIRGYEQLMVNLSENAR